MMMRPSTLLLLSLASYSWRFCFVGGVTTSSSSSQQPTSTPPAAVTKASTTTTTTTTNNSNNNPLWPSGISDEDVDCLIDEIIDDPRYNIAAIPDSLEQSIYKSVVRMCFNAIYKSLGGLHDKKFLGHQIQIYRRKRRDHHGSTTDGITAGNDTSNSLINHIEDRQRQLYFASILSKANSHVDISDEVLEETCDRLLSNQFINQKFIPDIIEKQLYMNCSKLVFRVMGMIAASLRITVCGHEIGLEISSRRRSNASTTTTNKLLLEPAFERSSISMAAISKAKLREFASQAAGQLVNEEEVDDDIIISEEDSSSNSKRKRRSSNNKRRLKRSINKNFFSNWWLVRYFKRRRQAFLVNLHASLWGLILGIVDDLLANTRIELLSDRVSFDIVPSSTITSAEAET